MEQELKLNFDKLGGLVPVIVQDAQTRVVLMLGFMNEEAYQKTREIGKVTFYSRTKQRLWTKGETSGNFLLVEDMLADCDQDTLLIKAKPVGPACHTGADTCFFENNSKNAAFLHYLQEVIRQRRNAPAGSSYTRSLFDKGINKIAQKVGEEAVEIVIESKDDNKDLFLNEAADLLFHLLVLLEAKNADLQEVIDILINRHK